MKKFLTEMSIAIVMIAVGCIVCVFEFKDYRIMNAYADAVDYKYETYDVSVDKEHPLKIELEDYVNIEYETEEDMGDQVELRVSENIEHKFSKNRLRVSDYSWYSVPFGSYLDAWINGLKDHKIYYFNSHEPRRDGEIVITCSEEAMEYIEVYQK